MEETLDDTQQQDPGELREEVSHDGRSILVITRPRDHEDEDQTALRHDRRAEAALRMLGAQPEADKE